MAAILFGVCELAALSVDRITTARLVLRKAHAGDVEGVVALQVDPAVRAYLGGPRPEAEVRDRIAAAGPERLTDRPGYFVVAEAASDRLLGLMMLRPREAELPGHVWASGGELELSYLFRPDAWGFGYATEAAVALLARAAQSLPDQPVLVVTQSANARSLALAGRLGFTLVDTFEQYDAEQSLLAADLYTFA